MAHPSPLTPSPLSPAGRGEKGVRRARGLPRKEQAMRDGSVTSIGACPELRQALEARPPGIVHGTVLLLVGLLGTGLAWWALAEADLVVRAGGRVRPVATPRKVFVAARGEVLSASPGARVAAAYVREGDEVRRGALLIRVETEQLDG